MPVLHKQPKPPPFVKTSKAFPIVFLKSLKPAHQKQIWQGIKNSKPELANMLVKNEAIEALKQAFDGQLVISREDAIRYYKAGKNNDKKTLNK